MASISGFTCHDRRQMVILFHFAQLVLKQGPLLHRQLLVQGLQTISGYSLHECIHMLCLLHIVAKLQTKLVNVLGKFSIFASLSVIDKSSHLLLFPLIFPFYLAICVSEVF